MKELGLNLLRKHIKIEPEVFYAYCDRHGMLVMQDMVNNGSYSFLRDTALPTLGRQSRNDARGGGNAKTRAAFQRHMTDTQAHLYNHPCIVAYTIFNEGWGQFQADHQYALARQNDPTRLYDVTSGWFAQHESDFDSYHVYFGDETPQPGQRPMLLSEFGGYTLELPGHRYAKYAQYGYGSCEDSDELTRRIVARYEELILPVIPSGCCGAVYTQLSDVEDECNGLYTYDRKIRKVDKKSMTTLARRLQSALNG
jgi:beta-galactosidase/beta-glucuronidase